MKASPPQLRIALVLGVAGTLATAALFPYLLALTPGALAAASVQTGLPPAAVVTAQSLQNGIVCFVLAWAGLKLGASLGLGAPWLAALLYGRTKPAASSWLRAMLFGAGGAVLVLAAIALFGAPIGPSAAQPPASLPFALKGLLAAPYGAIVEEVGLRVFAMGLAAWLLGRLRGGRPAPWIMPIAIVAAALMFGAGHLPLAAQLGPLTTGVVARVIGYNAALGLVFGGLYWKRGLEHAMLAHFAADVVLHGLSPLLAG